VLTVQKTFLYIILNCESEAELLADLADALNTPQFYKVDRRLCFVMLFRIRNLDSKTQRYESSGFKVLEFRR
jgi:hypothetical protein